MHRQLLVVVIILFSGIYTHAQTQLIESYKHRLLSEKKDTAKLKLLLLICGEIYSMSGDSLCHYAKLTENLALQLNDKKAFYSAANSYAFGLSTKGYFDSSNKYINVISNEIENNNAFLHEYVQLQLTRAFNYYKSSKSKQSLKNLFILKQKVTDTTDFKYAQIVFQMAVSYGGLEHYNESIIWANKASSGMDPTSNNRLKQISYSRMLMNKSIAYIHLYEKIHDPSLADSSFYYSSKAEAYCKKNEILFQFCQSQILIGYYYIYKKNYEKAEWYIQNGIKNRQLLKDPTYTTSDMTVLGTFYSKSGQTDKGIATCKAAIDTCMKYKLTLTLWTLAYKALAENYRIAENYKEYAHTLNQLLHVRDSLYLRGVDEELEKIEAVYDLQKKEIEITHHKSVLDRQNFWFYLILISTAFVIVTGLILFNSYRRNQKLKLHFVQEEEKRIAEQKIKAAEENERKRIAADLHDNLGVQANAIVYASEKLKITDGEQKDIANNLNANAKDMLFFLRETLWALKSTEVTMESVWIRLLNFITQMKKVYAGFTFKIEGYFPENNVISSAMGLNILMIVQEAVNNAIKHSNGNSITIAGTPTPTAWHITVTDNGKAFDIETVTLNDDNHGIKNMYNRASGSGLILEHIASESGTIVKLIVPLTEALKKLPVSNIR